MNLNLPAVVMTRRLFLTATVVALVALAGAGCRTLPPNTLATHDSSRWEKDIRAFEASDATNRPPAGCILFVGSSSIRLWKSLAADFPGLPVVNRGFGGSQLADAVNFADLRANAARWILDLQRGLAEASVTIPPTVYE